MLLNTKQEQTNEIYQHAFIGIIGHALVVVMCISILYGNVSNYSLYIWSLLTGITLALRANSVITFRRTKQHENQQLDTKKWVLIYQAGVFATGVMWGVTTFIFAHQFALVDFHFLMLAIAFGLAGAGIATLGVMFSTYAAFCIPMLTLISIDILMTDKPIHLTGGILSITAMFYLLYTAHRHSKRTFDLIKSKKEVENNQLDIIDRLGRAGEYRDGDTGLHIKRMSYSSYLLALECGLSRPKAEQILMAAPMHDIGKIGIPDDILLKPGKLSDNEWKIMKTHTDIGAEILQDNNSELLQLAACIAKNHHERWDGSGYPKGISENDIPLEARIVSICDVFDALTSVRPYKKEWSINDSLAHLERESGKQFDPTLVKLFSKISSQVIEYNNQFLESNDEAFRRAA